ncbi:MAG: pyridoxal-phosphate dependent enzyme [Clostridiales bacterium]|nr:pyridoxal-phosphate dependent enzyme [Clostridiales bacterium]
MTQSELTERINRLPRRRLSFLPTPLHHLKRLSAQTGVQMYLKREDLSGPGPFGGNKMRKLEFVLGQAMQEGVEYLVTYGAYQSNSAMQMTTAANACGLKSILFLGDSKGEGTPEDLTGNLLMDRLLGAEIHFVEKSEPKDALDLTALWNKLIGLCQDKVRQLEAGGHKALFVPLGAAHPYGYVSDVLNYLEIKQQCAQLGFEPDYICHSNSSGGSLPGLIAAKLILGDDHTKLYSFNIRSWTPGNVVTRATCVDRVHAIYDRLGLPFPGEEAVLAAMHIEEGYMAPGYAIPNPRTQQIIARVMRLEGILLDSTYTGKGFTGLLDYIEKQKIPAGSRVVFIHSGGVLGMFSGDAMLQGLL